MLNQNQRNFLMVVIFIGVLVLVALGAAWYTQHPLLSFLVKEWGIFVIFGGGLIIVPGMALWKFNVLKGIFFVIIGGGLLYLFGNAAAGSPDAKFLSGALLFGAFLGFIGTLLELHHRAQQENPRYNTLIGAIFTSLLLPIGFSIASGLIWGIIVFSLEWGLYIGSVILFRKAGAAIQNARK